MPNYVPDAVRSEHSPVNSRESARALRDTCQPIYNPGDHYRLLRSPPWDYKMLKLHLHTIPARLLYDNNEKPNCNWPSHPIVILEKPNCNWPSQPTAMNETPNCNWPSQPTAMHEKPNYNWPSHPTVMHETSNCNWPSLPTV